MYKLSDDSAKSERYHIPSGKYMEIIEISPDVTKVRIIGTVVDSHAGSLLVDDGTSSVTIITDKNIDIGSKVIVIGNVVLQNNEIIIIADAISEIKNFDVNLYKEVIDLEKKIELLYS